MKIPKAFEGKRVKCQCGAANVVEISTQEGGDLLSSLAAEESKSKVAGSSNWDAAQQDPNAMSPAEARRIKEEQLLNETMEFHRDPRQRDGFHGALAGEIKASTALHLDIITIIIWNLVCPGVCWVSLILVGLRLILQGFRERAMRYFIGAGISFFVQVPIALFVWFFLGFGAAVFRFMGAP